MNERYKLFAAFKIILLILHFLITQLNLMPHNFNRKIFTLKLLIKDSAFLLKNIFNIISIFFNKQISSAFIEKIMLVITAVNGCTYCEWFHAKKAVSSGISENEIKNMLNLQFEAGATDFEITGLLYAQHYAETDRNTDNIMESKLVDFYGVKTANHIKLIIKLIFFGNLTGNTFDAFLSRLKGNKAKNSNVIFEFIFFIINLPILLPILPFTKKYKK